MKIYYLIILFTLTSCLGSKKVSEKTSDKSVVEKTKQDSVAKETINKGIDDKATFKVAESNTGDVDFDKRVNDAVTNVLRSINFQKSSGDNSYQLYYNEKLRQLEAQVQVGQTSNKEVSTNKESDKEKTESTTESYKKVVRMVPWWGWLVVVWLLRKHIISVIAVFFPGVRGIKTVGDLFNPPNK